VAKQSAGILLYRVRTGAPEVLFAHPGGPFWEEKDLAAWSIPKAEDEEGEDPRAMRTSRVRGGAGHTAARGHARRARHHQAARRQARDGLGAEGDLGPAGVRSNRFTLEWPPRSGLMREFPEVDRAQWFPLAEARPRINPAQVAFLERLRETLEEKGRAPYANAAALRAGVRPEGTGAEGTRPAACGRLDGLAEQLGRGRERIRENGSAATASGGPSHTSSEFGGCNVEPGRPASALWQLSAAAGGEPRGAQRPLLRWYSRRPALLAPVELSLRSLWPKASTQLAESSAGAGLRRLAPR
jgi:predicted NUDIX family NTP pyrophosphohydrolase